MSASKPIEMSVRLSLSVENVDIDVCEYILSCYDPLNSQGMPPEKSSWSRTNENPPGPDYDIKVSVSYILEKWTVDSIIKGARILTPNEQIKEMLESALLELSFQRQRDIADGFDHEHNILVPQIDSDPYDPKKIRVEPKSFPVYHVYNMILDKDIDLSPDFQREFVWSDIKRRSRLIESLLLRIPLPVFYLSQDKEGVYQVVDGVQRLTVIRDFLNNKFRLRDLEYLTECNGKWFQDKNKDPSKSLDKVYVRRIQQTMLSFYVIDPQTPSKVKYDIFRRINTGGKELNRQEIRNCLETPRTRNFIRDLAESKEFHRATRNSVSPTRMADKEMALRFVAFYLADRGIDGQASYRGDMDSYLDDTIDVLNKLPDIELEKAKLAFLKAMENAYLIFGDNAFRKAKLINKALFLSWSRVLSFWETSQLKCANLGNRVTRALEARIREDMAYADALSKGTNDVRNMDRCLSVARQLMEEAIEVENTDHN